MNPTQGGWAIVLSIGFALVLSVIHVSETWPQWLGWLRPNWVALTVFYWVLAVPHRFGLVAAWLVGLLVDVLQGEPLGLNGIFLAVLTYITWSLYERLRMFAAFQQGIILFGLLVCAELARMILMSALGTGQWHFGFVSVALISALSWPLVRNVLNSIQRVCGVV